MTFQAEDEIAAVGAAVGAAFGGALGVTASAGPGVVLKAETVGLAIALELPLVILDIQRAGPSTGMPTKPEQADLLMVLFGRNGESPVPVVAASTPSQCFDAAIEAARIALKYRTPVYLLSDAYLANGSEPWLIPDVGELPDISTSFAEAQRRSVRALPPRPGDARAPVGDSGHHRVSSIGIGGLEKADVTGAISYDPDNHDQMVRLRAQKVAGIAADIPELEVDDPDGDAELLVIGWGSTYGPIVAGVRRVRKRGLRVAHTHLHHLNPLPANTGDVLRRYPKVLVPEMNLGQLAMLLRARVPRRRRLVHASARAAARRPRARGGDRRDGGLVSAFTALVTRDERVLVTREGRTVAVLAGASATRLARGLARSPDERARQLLLARATGNYRRGNER